ncbi:D-alanyl-D-alanine carboxypeptidase [Canicola haemoglobinophilus]|uniref:D-alanyl-D-alanine carboxypeptidase n=1 Tax=Canicola haemoglobinophilus TaxID=733 RepID=A0AB38H7S8_9PAST|nr:serine-type D-Ala-D-Ala carboxypeptidase [Canicola haemoglobinophilus]STO53764.1 D-alanyl-D-alanine carboxypeptidase [Canicola haemoglobinophilus]STO68297.1 D-alanyl-D-alanine carboxypeptidase [Canicola haemoglobinophilus]
MCKLISKFKLGLLTLSLSISQYNLAQVDMTALSGHLPEGAQLGFIAKNLHTNRISAEFNAHSLMLPASTQKVLTALAAKLTLGDQFKFETSLLTNGKIENSQLKGDLIVKFTGDPDLTSGQLYNLLAQLKQKGVSKITGNLILDTSVFAGHDRGLGWIWNDLTMCFNSPPAAVNIDNNCFYVDLDATQAAGELVKFNIPAQYPVQVFGQVRIASKEESPYCTLDAVVHDNNRYQIKGCLSRQTKPFGLSFAVQDPNAYAAAIISRQLTRLGIQFSGNIQQPHSSSKGILLAQHLSKPLPDLLKKMMKKSDNQIADALFRTIAYQYYKRPATFQLGAMALMHILQSKAGIKFNNANIADGSGLSRHNLITPQIMLQALEYIAKHEAQLGLLETFPIAGVDGTLSGRGSMIKEPLMKNIIAKTGALKNVYNLAGFITNERGEKIAFVQFINGYSTGNNENKVKRAPLVQFENSIYNHLYQE